MVCKSLRPRSATPVTAPIPLLTMGINSSPLDLNTGFILTYSTIELANGNTAGEWQELQIPSGPLVPQLVLENDGNANMFAFNVGFQFSNTEIPLDDLNLQDYPPSSFTPVPGLPDNSMSNPTEIAPSSYDVVNLPEPSSIALFALVLPDWFCASYAAGKRPGLPAERLTIRLELTLLPVRNAAPGRKPPCAKMKSTYGHKSTCSDLRCAASTTACCCF